MHSCIYEGAVSHRRCEPLKHGFEYRLFMVCLDLDELPGLVGASRLIARDPLGWCSFRPSDHLYDASGDLANEVRRLVRDRTGISPTGPIRLLTQLRICGLYFSPLNLFYLYDASGKTVQFVVAEVNNTPWNERHCYVLWDGNRQCKGHDQTSKAACYTHAKEFHVSPYMEMQQQYHWRLTQPGASVHIQLSNKQQQRTVFTASLSLKRRELNRHQLRRMQLSYPVMTAKIVAAIYFQAFKLWWKKCPLYTHPKNKPSLPDLVATTPLPASAKQPHDG